MQRTASEHVLPLVRPIHPSEDELERFMRGELSRTQVLPVVRHLLAGCPQCVKVTGRLWELGEKAPASLEELES